jgi:type I restriction enzyme, R subunit
MRRQPLRFAKTDVERGFADYGLFLDAKAIGVLEAKAEGTPLVGVADQSEAYARSKLTDFQRWAFPLPFTYESNGDEIRFRDLRDPRSRSRFLFTTHRPETLRAWIEQPDTLRARLQKPPLLITTGLRTCQVDAVNGLEKSFARQHPREEGTSRAKKRAVVAVARKLAVLLLSLWKNERLYVPFPQLS